MAKYGKLAGKILELLANGFLLGFVRDRSERRKLLEDSDKIWHTLDRKVLHALLARLRLSGYIKILSQSGGREKISLTALGRRRHLAYKLYHLKLSSKKRWDKKWRIVLFDIPEAQRKIRDALRKKLKELGFLEFQKSVFIFPYPCEDEINFVINFFGLSDHVYYLEAPIAPDDIFRRSFQLR